MKTRKLKRLGITAVLAVLMMSFAITAMAAGGLYQHTVSTTTTSSGQYYTIAAGPVTLYGHLAIRNEGVDAEHYTAKVGNVSKHWEADGKTHTITGTLSSSGSTRRFLGMNRTVEGTKIYGYIKATN